jgi:hypothetical protein
MAISSFDIFEMVIPIFYCEGLLHVESLTQWTNGRLYSDEISWIFPFFMQRCKQKLTLCSPSVTEHINIAKSFSSLYIENHGFEEVLVMSSTLCGRSVDSVYDTVDGWGIVILPCEEWSQG